MNQVPESAINQPKKQQPLKLKPIHEDLMGLLLKGKNQKQAAIELGLSESYVSKLVRWPLFARKFRERRAAIIEASDAGLMAADQMATFVLVAAMQYAQQQQTEVVTKSGATKIKTIPPDMPLALNAACKVKALNRERAQMDALVARLERLEAKYAKDGE